MLTELSCTVSDSVLYLSPLPSPRAQIAIPTIGVPRIEEVFRPHVARELVHALEDIGRADNILSLLSSAD
jgi:hypothetical protein